MSLTEDVTIKPLVICGGCSFTHSPDSWANVLGNYREIHNGFARKFFEVWRDAGIKETGADPSILDSAVNFFKNKKKNDLVIYGLESRGVVALVLSMFLLLMILEMMI